MSKIETIDLWTEQLTNHQECFNGAFVDGFESSIPFDSYKVIRNCNCIITSNTPLNITNKHQAIVYYKNNEPVRLMVINKDTDINKAISVALDQVVNGKTLRSIYESIGIRRIDINLGQTPIINESNHENEIDVGSCDRPSLLTSMLEGSYTESDTGYGKDNDDNDFNFVPNINIQYELYTGDDYFIINHSCAFINHDMSRIIPLQDNSQLDIEEITNEYSGKSR